MGVLPCSRKHCESVMCDRYSNEHGYICDECYNELMDKPWTDIDEFFESDRSPSHLDLQKWENHLHATFHWR